MPWLMQSKERAIQKAVVCPYEAPVDAQNILRVLWLINKFDLAGNIASYIKSQGSLVVVDNIRPGNKDFIPENELISMFESQGLVLNEAIPLRRSRWWIIYLIRYGLIPRKFLKKIANYELEKCRYMNKRFKYQYLNIMFIFTKP